MPAQNGSREYLCSRPTSDLHLQKPEHMPWYHDRGELSAMHIRQALFDQYPARPHERKCYQSDARSDGDEDVGTQFPSRQRGETEQGDEDGQPVADGNPGEQHPGSQNRPDGRGVRPLYESLHIPILSVAAQRRRGNEDKYEGRQEDSGGRDDRTPKSRDQIANKRCGDEDRTGTQHADGYGNQKSALIQPSRLPHQSLFQKRHNDQPAPKREGAGFEKAEQQSSDDRTGGARN